MPLSSFKSMVALWHHRTSSTPDADAMYGRRPDGGWYTLSWRESARYSRLIACGLHALAVEKAQRCAILSATRPEWVLADMGILAAGAATTTIYPSNTAEECAYILQDSGAVVCFVDTEAQAEKLRGVRDQLPALKHVVLFEGDGDGEWTMGLRDLEALGERWDKANPLEYKLRAEAVEREDLATLIYTSGTTGKPKGVMLTHDCWVFESEAIDKLGLIGPSDKHYLFLPLAHSFAKVLECAFIRAGTPTVVDGDVDDLMQNMQATSPTVMGAVPRIFEKVFNHVVTQAEQAGGPREATFKWALSVGKEVSALRQQGREPRMGLAVKHRLADRLVFSKLKEVFGGRLRWFISGGAPLSKDIAEFFHAADVLVLEGYGLTESSAASFVNRPEAYRFGTVGQALPGVQVQIAEDGEILLGGRGIMGGYHGLEADTLEVLPGDGFLRTGDIGELDADGFLRITDRKKDIIVTAGGKNIAPQVIENALKARSPYISQVVMHGDKRNFCVALITIHEGAVGAWARERGLTWSGYAELAAKPEVLQLIRAEVDALNRTLAPYETIKDLAILDHDLSVESGELTPKMSVKRREVERRYAELLDGFYEGSIKEL